MTIDQLLNTARTHKITEAELDRLERRRNKIREQLAEISNLLLFAYTSCPGVAHKDNIAESCPVCVPRWGVIPDSARVVGKLSGRRPLIDEVME